MRVYHQTEYCNKRSLFLVKSTDILEFRILINELLLHADVTQITNMFVHLFRDANGAIFEHQSLHGIKRPIDTQVLRICVLELHVIVAILVVNDLVPEATPRW